MSQKVGALVLFLSLFLVPNITFAQFNITGNPPSCDFNTSQLIKYYGYQDETYTVQTSDGYILTLFRCNSKQVPVDPEKVVILFHGLLGSSDDFSVNIPSQASAYVLADAGYDVWLPNVRGNTYSRKHITKNPDNPFSSFWNFSWDTIGFYDFPAVFDFVLQKTNNTKAYTVGHSQGTSSLMAFLSQRPEYNSKVTAASLMAPIGYVNSTTPLGKFIAELNPILDLFQNLEILSKSLVSYVTAFLCKLNVDLCDNVHNILYGQSPGQRNETMLPSFVCHEPNGASSSQFLHYGDETRLGYFGPRLSNPFGKPTEFDLSKITAPISLHYSTNDNLSHENDVKRLIPKLNNSLSNVQLIDEVQFNHIDYIWGINATDIVYSNILRFFDSINCKNNIQ